MWDVRLKQLDKLFRISYIEIMYIYHNTKVIYICSKKNKPQKFSSNRNCKNMNYENKRDSLVYQSFENFTLDLQFLALVIS